MKLLTVRRLAVVAASALAATALVSSGPAGAASGDLSYTCPVEGAPFPLPLKFSHDTDAPETPIYAGHARSVQLTSSTTLNPLILAIVRGAGVTSFEGELETTVVRNGVTSVVQASIPRTQVPANQQESLTLSATGPLPTLTQAAAGTSQYLPGNIVFSVRAYDENDEEVVAIADSQCTLSATTAVIDTVTFVKSASRTIPAVSYSKTKKKVTASAAIARTSGVAAAGKVTFTLLKGKKKVKAVVANVGANKARAVFTGIKTPGTYKVVTTYSGSPAVKGSTATSKTFTIKKKKRS